MEIKINGNGANDSGVIWLNQDHENFKVSIMLLPAGGFDGTINVSYSPDGTNWFPHADMTGLTGAGAKAAGNIFFPVPAMKVAVTGGTTGTVTAHVFGSLAL